MAAHAVVSAAWRCRPAVRRASRKVFAALRLGAAWLWGLLAVLSFIAGWALWSLSRWTARHPRAAGSVTGVAALAVLALVVLAPEPIIETADAPFVEDDAFERSLACMVQNLYHEARGEPTIAQVAIAKVVLNRVGDRRFPGTVCDVVKQGGEWPRHRCQFSWWCDGRSDKTLDQRSMARLHTVAREVLMGHHDDPTDGALWYHARSVSPNWRRDYAKGPTIGNHIFYRPR